MRIGFCVPSRFGGEKIQPGTLGCSEQVD